MLLRWIVLISVLGGTWAAASPVVHVPARHAQQLFTSQFASVPGFIREAVLQMPSTLKARMLVAIARGDLGAAIALWELEMGRRAPQWLTEFQAAFNVANQRAGPCVEVAKSVFEGFRRLGEKLSINFYHYAVQVKDRVYDAMTGPTGLTMQVVSELP